MCVLHAHPQSMLQKGKGNLRVTGVNAGGGGGSLVWGPHAGMME